MNFLHNQPATATAKTYPMRFLVIDPAVDFGVKPAVTPKSRICGVSQVGPKQAPGLLSALGGTDDDFCANVGDGVGIYLPGDVCLIEVGSAAVTAGDYLKNDLNSKAIPSSSGEPYGAQAWQSGQPGEKIQAQVLIGTTPAP